MAILTLQDAERIAIKNRPWALRLEFVGSNPANSSGISQKFWQATGRGLTETVEVGWGPIGGTPQTQLVTFAEFRNRCVDKIAKGYDWADTPYFRMSPTNLALLGGHKPVGTSPAPTAQTLVIPSPTVGPVIPAPTISTKAPAASLLALPLPWNLIRELRVVRDGTTIKGFDAIDEKGDILLRFDEPGGREFARDHDLEMVWTSSKKTI